MSLLKPTMRLLRTQRLQCLRAPTTLPIIRHLSSKPNSSPQTRVPLDPITLHRLEAQRRAYYKRRSYYAAAGVVFGMIAIYLTATQIDLDPPKAQKLDSNRRSDDPLVVLGRERKVVVQKLGEEPEEVPDVVKTGTSSVPTFPRVLEFVDDEGRGPAAQGKEDRLVEYQLLGLGVRTVSFLGIEVYVVGMYIATDDIATLQAALIKQIAKGASSLVKGEKEELKKQLYESERGMQIWDEILKEAGIRTLVRIVPTKNTDFGHLRDAWVRLVTAKVSANPEAYGDEVYGQSVQKLKGLFAKGSVPKGKELLLSRDGKGKMAVWYDDGKIGARRLGDVGDERISRAVWLNYLAGKNVASEPARKSIIDGVMEFVERPVGTVATQVQVQTHL